MQTGELIRQLREEQGMTQKQLAERLYISDKTVSKWERDCGLPEISLLSKLAAILRVDVEQLLRGDLELCESVGGNMKKASYYICPICGNITVCTGTATVSCCGRPLEAQTPVKADDRQALQVTPMDNDWYVTSDHPMQKDNYIPFVAFVTGESIQMYKQYPEWNLSLHIPMRGHGTLLWYLPDTGLLFKRI